MIGYMLVAGISIFLPLHAIQQQRSPHNITFFVLPYFAPTTVQNHNHLEAVVAKPNKLDRDMVRKYTKHHINQGILVNYAGVVTFSNEDGQVTLPLRQTKERVAVVVAQSITPVLLQGNTVHHFEVSPHVTAAYYIFERIKDRKLNKYVWKITQTKLPKNNKIPASALVIMADPEDIMIFEGSFPTEKSPNFVLPDIYVKPTIAQENNVLHFIKTSKFFAPVKPLIKYDSDRYMRII